MIGLAVVVSLLVLAGGRIWSNAGAEELSIPWQGGDNNIIVQTVALSAENYSIIMVDTAAKTMWVYEVNSRAASHNKLRLIAARRWEYDAQLDEYNTGEPRPGQVQQIVEKMRMMPKSAESTRQQLEDIAEP